MSADRRDAQPLVSCLCVTENRPAFLPWLLWNYDRQKWARRELVVIDSSSPPAELPERPDVRLVSVRKGASVAAKRNLALDSARGELLTWFDDDDWQHPEKISRLSRALGGRRPFAGCRQSWFVDLRSRRCSSYRVRGQRMLFNGSLFRTEMARQARFDERLRKASDTRWMRELARRCGSGGASVDPPLFFWLCHGDNLSNPAHKRRFGRSLDVLERFFGSEIWGDTSAALDALAERLVGSEGKSSAAFLEPSSARTTHSSTSAEATPVAPARPAPSAHTPPGEAAREAMDVPVTAIVKATTLDAACLAESVPHMLRQARYPFAERIVVVDPRRDFSGKYRNRAGSSREQLDAALGALLERGEIDRVEEVSYEPGEVDAVNRRYFRRVGVPTHATTGGPIYPTLWGMEQARTDHLVQFDADMLFYTDGESWVGRALGCMAADRSLWAMMTHPGPPAGGRGRSLKGRNARLATWDRDLRLWRFRHATTRYFLCDRRLLRGKLRPVPYRSGCAPLEHCLSAALRRHGAFRGALGELKSWHLHAWSHAAPYPEWLGALAAAVSEGRVPSLQRGEYDLRLDRPRDRRAWGQLLAARRSAQPKRSRAAAARRSREAVAPATAAAPAARKAPGERAGRAPLSVVISIRNRAGQRLVNTMRGLAWQEAGPPAEIVVVSHGSRPEIDRELETICSDHGARLLPFGSPEEPWNKPLALNLGIRSTDANQPFLMTMDADMILAPNFLSAVIARLESEPPALALCRICDLPKGLRLPRTGRALRTAFDRLRRKTRLRHQYGTGAMQAARRDFFFDVRGYDEDMLWWGAMDNDLVHRAERAGLEIAWLHDRTCMLHQWHPRKHRVLDRPDEVAQARRAWIENHRLARRRRTIRRNPGSWGVPALAPQAT